MNSFNDYFNDPVKPKAPTKVEIDWVRLIAIILTGLVSFIVFSL